MQVFIVEAIMYCMLVKVGASQKAIYCHILSRSRVILMSAYMCFFICQKEKNTPSLVCCYFSDIELQTCVIYLFFMMLEKK